MIYVSIVLLLLNLHFWQHLKYNPYAFNNEQEGTWHRIQLPLWIYLFWIGMSCFPILGTLLNACTATVILIAEHLEPNLKFTDSLIIKWLKKSV